MYILINVYWETQQHFYKKRKYTLTSKINIYIYKIRLWGKLSPTPVVGNLEPDLVDKNNAWVYHTFVTMTL